MIKLCGFALSNYYNKVKFVLLEHEIPFEESLVMTSQDESLLGHSPLGKVPFIQTEQGDLCESQAIIEYLHARFPERDFLRRPVGSGERARADYVHRPAPGTGGARSL